MEQTRVGYLGDDQTGLTYLHPTAVSTFPTGGKYFLVQ